MTEGEKEKETEKEREKKKQKRAKITDEEKLGVVREKEQAQQKYVEAQKQIEEVCLLHYIVLTVSSFLWKYSD